MPRPIRLEYKNAFYHLMNLERGRQTIFPAEQFYQIFQKTLQEVHDRFGLEIHAFCLMSNHYHLLVKTPNVNLSCCMRHINGLFTQRHNRLKRIDGPLFRGRYRAILVDKDNYFLRVTRYIHRNPLETRTPIVKRLVDYPWSSYASYINQAPIQNRLYKTETFELLGGGDKRYQHYVEDHANDLEVTEF
ncbi:MAG: putative transposase [Glaciecola sp.]|jgi:putative transposase